MTLEERRRAALDKCNEVCHREYAKYLNATSDARAEYFDTLKRIDAEAEAALQKVALG